MLRRSVLIVIMALLTSGFVGGWSSSKPETWNIWAKNNAKNSKPVNHQAWDNLLKRHIRKDSTGLNRFSYTKVTSKEKAALKNYIKTLSSINVTSRSRRVQLAYWINLYNALTISVVLDHLPVKSIRDIDISGFLANGPWGAKIVKVENTALSLDDIEHRILRPIWKDPRIHYAVNCASVGCPNLHNRAYTAKTVNRVLNQVAREYINHPRGLSIRDGQVTVSKIYKWFAHDFGNSETRIIQHLAKYATPKRARELKKIGRISNTQYDWSLNE